MGRSFLGGFLGALLALALVGAALAMRGFGPDEGDPRRAALARQIDEWERWRRDDPDGRRVQPIGHNSAVVPLSRSNDPWAPDDPDVVEEFLAPRRELAAYRAWLFEQRFKERCPRQRTYYCRLEAAHIDTAELRDPKHLDAYLAARR